MKTPELPSALYSILLLAIVAALTIPGCATYPDDVEPMPVPANTYNEYSCKELERELIRLRKEEGELGLAMAGEYGGQIGTATAATFAAPAIVGVPVLATTLGTNETKASKLSRIRGEIEGTERESEKRCTQGEATAIVKLGDTVDSERLIGPVSCLPMSPPKQLCELTRDGRRILLAVVAGEIEGIRRSVDGDLVWTWAQGCTKRFAGFSCE